MKIQKLLKERIGEERLNSQGYLMKIIKYENANNITIQFQDKNKAMVDNCYSNFLKGLIKNPFHRTICGVGYIGNFDGYPVKEKSYVFWDSMIRRCYDKNSLKKSQTYMDCEVCEEWHCFSLFHKWFLENYYEVDGEKMNLDKDILIKNNRIYSPKTCVFVPHKINMLVVNKKSSRGMLPVGVVYRKELKKPYAATLGSKRIGNFDNQFDAFYCYKKEKEAELKIIAEKYKDYIPEKLYIALLNYPIELED